MGELNSLGWYKSNEFPQIKRNHPAKTGIGIQSMLFVKGTGDEKEYAYTYAGTNSWEDLVEDVTQLIGVTSMYTKAIENGKAFHEAVGKHELTFVGHSAGGAEAAAAGMSTGRNVIGFNPAALSLPTKIRYWLTPSGGTITNYISSTPEIPGLH